MKQLSKDDQKRLEILQIEVSEYLQSIKPKLEVVIKRIKNNHKKIMVRKISNRVNQVLPPEYQALFTEDTIDRFLLMGMMETKGRQFHYKRIKEGIELSKEEVEPTTKKTVTKKKPTTKKKTTVTKKKAVSKKEKNNG